MFYTIITCIYLYLPVILAQMKDLVFGALEIWFVAQMKDFFGANEMPIGANEKHRKRH